MRKTSEQSEHGPDHPDQIEQHAAGGPSAQPAAKGGPGSSAMPTGFAVLFALSTSLVATLLWPFVVRIFLAACLAVTLFPLHRLLRSRWPNKPTRAAAISTLLLLVAGLAPLGALAAYSAGEIADGIHFLKDNLDQGHLKELTEGRVPAPLRGTVGRVLATVNVTPEDLEGYSDRITSFLQALTPKLAGASIDALVGFVFVLFGCFLFLTDGHKLLRHLFAVSPLEDHHTRRLFDDFRSVAQASLLGVVFTAVGQGLVLSFGYWLASMPHVFFLSMLTFLAAFVPLAGSMLVWLPVVIGAALTFGAKTAVPLAIYSVVSTNIVDGVLKPMLMQGRMEMPGVLTFLGILGGLAAFGPVGFIAGPLCFAFFLSFLQMYERDYLPQDKAHRDSEA